MSSFLLRKIAVVIGVCALIGGGYFGVLKLADDRCDGKIAAVKLEAERQKVKTLTKGTEIRHGIRKATDDDLDSRAAGLGIMRDD
jgi:hypothetical protein